MTIRLSHVWYLIAFLLFAVGALLALYGVFALLYDGDGHGPTHVMIAGQRIDAHLAGGLSLAMAVPLVASGAVVVRRRRIRG